MLGHAGNNVHRTFFLISEYIYRILAEMHMLGVSIAHECRDVLFLR